jgi:hypothetical protein
MNLDDIYTPLEEAKEEIQRRWEDKELKKKVDDFIGGDIPDLFNECPFAMLGRHIMTSNIETIRFSELSKEVGLKPLGFEYLDDRFLTMNKSKLSLGKMSFLCSKTNKRKDIFDIFNLQDNNGKKFTEITTFWGEKLVDFHHKLITRNVPDVKLVDMSEWIKKRGEKAADFYHHYLAMFIRNGILFDNYLEKGKESKFTSEVFMPSYEKVFKHFGIKPLIVQLSPKADEYDVSWCFYEMHNIIE